MFIVLLGVTSAAPIWEDGVQQKSIAIVADCGQYVSVPGQAWPDKMSKHEADVWCSANCDAGFCPEDRCKCGTHESALPSKRNKEKGKCEEFCYTGERAQGVAWKTRCLWSGCDDCKECNQMLGQRDESIMTPLEICKERWSAGLTRDFPAATEDGHPDLRGDKCLKRPTPHLLFIHVGKTCGDTVISALDKNSMKIKSIDEHSGRDAYDMVHVHPVRAEVVASMDNILITMRDPVDRLISAYNNAACLAEGVNRDICERTPTKQRNPNVSAMRRPGSGPLWNYKDPWIRDLRIPELGGFVMQCFPNVTVFADHIDDDTACGRIARDMIGPDRADAGVSHVGRGNCYYMGGILQWLPGKRIHIVNTEDCEEGIRRIPKWLGLQGKYSRFEKGESIHQGEFPHHYDQVSPAGRKRLERHLRHEYALRDEIRRIARESWAQREALKKVTEDAVGPLHTASVHRQTDLVAEKRHAV